MTLITNKISYFNKWCYISGKNNELLNVWVKNTRHLLSMEYYNPEHHLITSIFADIFFSHRRKLRHYKRVYQNHYTIINFAASYKNTLSVLAVVGVLLVFYPGMQKNGLSKPLA